MYNEGRVSLFLSHSTKPKVIRLGLMGHLTFMEKDIITALNRFPLDLRCMIERFAPQPESSLKIPGVTLLLEMDQSLFISMQMVSTNAMESWRDRWGLSSVSKRMTRRGVNSPGFGPDWQVIPAKIVSRKEPAYFHHVLHDFLDECVRDRHVY